MGKKESQIAIPREGGELIEKRMRTERERVRQHFADRPKAKVLREAQPVAVDTPEPDSYCPAKERSVSLAYNGRP